MVIDPNSDWALMFNSIYDPTGCSARLFRSGYLGQGHVEVPIRYVGGSWPGVWTHHMSEWELRPMQHWRFTMELILSDKTIVGITMPVYT